MLKIVKEMNEHPPGRHWKRATQVDRAAPAACVLGLHDEAQLLRAVKQVQDRRARFGPTITNDGNCLANHLQTVGHVLST